MSLKDQKPQSLPRYLPDTRAIAFGGEITAIRPDFLQPGPGSHEDGDHDHEPVSIPLEGVSGALGPAFTGRSWAGPTRSPATATMR
jgi:hypothetical protein